MNKTKILCREVVWQINARIVRGGHTVQSAINQIHSAYGFDTSITKLIGALFRDKDRYPGGIHPSLR